MTKRAILIALVFAVTILAQTHSVTLTWAANSAGAPVTTYNVLRGTASGAESSTPIGLVLASACAASCSYVDSVGLVEGQTYFYEITATGSAGTSGPSPEVTAFVPFSGPPNPPAKPTVEVK